MHRRQTHRARRPRRSSLIRRGHPLRPALHVLIDIYHGLLKRIESHNYSVFSTRIAVPTSQKLFILIRGMIQVFFYRLVPARSGAGK